MPRRDNRGTARSPLRGAITQPKLLHREFLGSSVNQLLVEEAGSNGERRVFFVSGGRVVALDREGVERWRSDTLDVSFIEGVHDLAGDGRRQLVVLRWGGVTALDLETGAVAWEHTISLVGGFSPASLKVGRIDLSRRGEQILFFPYGAQDTFMFAFDQGVESGYVAWTLPDSSAGFPPSPAVADVDGDGANEICLMAHHRVVVYNPADGSEKQRIAWQNVAGEVRNYGYLGLTAIAPDAPLGGILLSVGVAYHAERLSFQGAGQVVWSEYLGGQDDVSLELESTPQPLADVDGDGALELVYSARYERADKKGWFVQVRDALSGALKQEIAGARLLDLLDLDGDGAAELVIERTGDAGRSVNLLALGAGAETPLGNYDLRIDTTRRYNLHETNTYYPFGGYIVRNWAMRADLDGDGRPELIAVDRATGRQVGLGLEPDGRAKVMDLCEACQAPMLWVGDLDGSGAISFITATDSGMRFVRADGQAGPVVTGGAYMARPLLADLDGDGRVEIVVGGRGLAPEPGDPLSLRELWRLPIRSMAAPKDCVALWDLDRDGKQEIIGWETDAANAPQMVVYDAAGALRWRAALPEHGPGSTVMMWTVGRFQGGDAYDIYVAGNRGATGGASLVLSGQDGRPFWMETASLDRALFPHSGYPTVMDIDGDGADDVAMIAGPAVEFLSGPDGGRIGETPTLNGILSTDLSTFYYGSAVFVDLDGDVREEVLMAGVWGGIGVTDLARQRLWSRAFEVPSKSFIAPPRNREAAVADVDGDGALEVLCHIPNYKLRCYEGMTGKRKWTVELDGGNPSEPVVCDIDGDGREEVLFGTNLGHLYAVRGKPEGDAEVLFALELPASLGVPVVGDVNGDGLAEILIVSSDGYLNIVSGE